jgi:hypothetical protein
MADKQTIDEWLVATVGSDQVESAKERLAELIREALESDDEVEVNEQWWQQLDQDIKAIASFMTGTARELPRTRLLTALVMEVAEGEPPIPLNETYWDVVRNRLRTLRPPGI